MSPHPDAPRTRLHVAAELRANAEIVLEEKQAHYLATVLRAKPGGEVALFNGRDGEWLAAVVSTAKKNVALAVKAQLRPQAMEPDLWLLYAPLKGGRSEWVAEKATELGVARICPVLTRFTVADRINEAKLSAIAREAAEQCERLTVPSVTPLVPLSTVLSGWDIRRRLIFGDESGGGVNACNLLSQFRVSSSRLREELEEGAPCLKPPEPPHLTSPASGGGMMNTGKALTTPLGIPLPLALLIGPEGGFSTEELEMLRRLPYVSGMCLGPRILRADTAAVAALALLQAFAGDWDGKPAFRSASSN